MIPEIRNHSYHQRFQDLDLISLVQRRLRGQLIEVSKYLNEFTNASARGLVDYDLNDRTRNNGAKLIIKHFNTSIAQHLYPIKLTTTWNALRSALPGASVSECVDLTNQLLSCWVDPAACAWIKH